MAQHHHVFRHAAAMALSKGGPIRNSMRCPSILRTSCPITGSITTNLAQQSCRNSHSVISPQATFSRRGEAGPGPSTAPRSTTEASLTARPPRVEYDVGTMASERTWREMLQFVDQLYDPTVTNPRPSAQQMRVVLLYWLSEGTQNLANKRGTPNFPLIQLEHILDWLVGCQDPALIQGAVLDPQSSRNHLHRLLTRYLKPFQGTMKALDSYGVKTPPSNDNERFEALYRASNVWQRIEQWQNDPSFLRIQPDEDFDLSTTTLWSRRCKYLTERGGMTSFTLDTTDLRVQTALGGKSSVAECLEALKSYFQQIEQRASVPVQSKQFDSMYLSWITSLSYRADPSVVDEALDILQNLEARTGRPAKDDLYRAVLIVHAKEAIRDCSTTSLNRALRYWEHIKNLPNLNVRHDPQCYSIVMDMCGKVGNPEATQEILDEMESSSFLSLNLIHYNVALDAWARSRRPDSPGKVEALLYRMFAKSQGRPDLMPDRISITTTIDTLMTSTEPLAFEKASAILSQAESSESHQLLPDLLTYKVLIRGLLTRQSREADEKVALQAKSVLYRIQALPDRSPVFQGPILSLYVMCLYAWLETRSLRASTHAMDIFNLMTLGRSSGKIWEKPELRFYECLLKCLAIHPTDSSLSDCRAVLESMKAEGLSVNLSIMTQYLRVIARAGSNGLLEVEKMLEAMEQDGVSEGQVFGPQISNDEVNNQGAEPAADALLKRVQRLAATITGGNAQQSGEFYASLMFIWGSSQEPNAIERVESLFHEVSRTEMPSSAVYAALQKAWVNTNRPDAPYQVERILNEMYEDFVSGKNPFCKPEARNFSEAIDAWSKSREEISAERAEAILLRLLALSQQGDRRFRDLRPTASSYRGAIFAWSVKKHPDIGHRAVRLLDLMEENAASDPLAPRPMTSCYKCAIQAVSRSPDPAKAQRAYSLLQRLKKAPYSSGRRHAEPNLATYCAVIQACGRVSGDTPEEKGQALAIATRTLQEYLEGRKSPAEPEIYVQYLRAVFCLASGETREQAVKAALENCSASFLETPEIQRELQRTVLLRVFHEIMTHSRNR